MPTVIVPVGLNLGPSYRYTTPPDPTPEHWEVRLATEAEELTADEFQVWGRAFLDPERHARLEVTRDTLRRDVVAAGNGPTDPDPVIDRLLERGLLVEYDPEGPLEKVFRRYKLFPIAEGMGNTPDEPDRYHIGHNGVSLVKVNYTVYGMLAFSSTVAPSLWEACVDFQAGAVELREAGEDVDEAPAEEVAREIAITAPMLVASGCAFFDVAR
jgi:hypothetical protein